MRKVTAAINMSVDGNCDHTAGLPDEEIHDHYTALIRGAGDMIYGRTTYELMKDYWPQLVKNPSGQKSMDDFAIAIENIHKTVFSHTLKDAGWKNARVATGSLKDEINALRKQDGKDILVGSPGMISALTALGMIDEYQLCIHPVIAGAGLPLFKDVTEQITLTLFKTKVFRSGAIILYYTRGKNNS